MTTIADNIARVKANITTACARVGRDPAEVTLVAISKRKPVADIIAAWSSGIRDFGENRVEEALEKIREINTQLAVSPTWHMVGHIQSRKARDVVALFDQVHSVDSAKIAHRLDAQASQQERILPVLLEINVSGEVGKYGLTASNWERNSAVRDSIRTTVAEIIALPNLKVIGLMTMAPYLEEPEKTRPVFAGLAALREMLVAELSHPLPELSMGMTNDYSVAVEEGATIVRIGSAIFGERN